jgi:nitrite reductase (NADH) large subunit
MHAFPQTHECTKLVIIGHGMVSHRLCELLVQKRLNAQFRITVLGEEMVPAYDRVHLGQLLAPEHDTAGHASLASCAWYEEHGITLALGDRATAIDRHARAVTLASGLLHDYDTLVLATGARARLPRVEGLRDVLVYRTLEDVRSLRDAARPGRIVAILGGGLLGIEGAEGLSRLGCLPTIYEVSASLLPRHLDADSARVLQAGVARCGIGVRTGFHLQRVSRDARGGYLLHADSRPPEHCDVLVAAVGVDPEDSLARAAGLQCAPAGGVAVSETLATDDAAIYAVGDCAAYRGRSVGLVAPGYEMAEVLAARLAGDETRTYRDAGSPCRLKLAGTTVLALGRYDMEAERHRYFAQGIARTIVISRGTLVGATIVGDWGGSASLERAIGSERTIARRHITSFERCGELGLSKGELPVAQWPRDALVCQCARITRGTVSDAIEHGARDLDALRGRSRAGTICGSCAPLLATLLGTRVEAARVPYARLTAISSALLFICVLCLAFVPSLTASRSVQDLRFAVELLWRSSTWRQVSGYTVVGLFAFGLLLPLRKRLAWPRWGAFGSYRALHTCLGLLSAVALCVHTGMHLGSHLNFALAFVFLLAASVGGCAGIAAGLEGGRGAAWARAARGHLSRLHLLLLWPLPVLLAFHVIAVYYF